MVCQSEASKQKKKKEKLRQTQPPKRKYRKRRPGAKSGGGGGCRAFFHSQLKLVKQKETNQSKLFGDIHKAWKALSPEERKKYNDIGQAASISHRAGFKSFGTRRRQTSAIKSLHKNTEHRNLESELATKRQKIKTQRASEQNDRQRQTEQVTEFVRSQLGLGNSGDPSSDSGDARGASNIITPWPVSFPHCEFCTPNALVTQDRGPFMEPLHFQWAIKKMLSLVCPRS